MLSKRAARSFQVCKFSFRTQRSLLPFLLSVTRRLRQWFGVVVKVGKRNMEGVCQFGKRGDFGLHATAQVF